MQLIDTHAHLDIAYANLRSGDRIISRSDIDLSPLLNRAREVGVTKIITVASDIADLDNVVAIANQHDNVWATVGVHSDDTANFDNSTLEKLRRLIKGNPKKIVAIGEIGFDFGPHGQKAPAEQQEKIFRQQLDLAREFDLPAIIHTREADELTLNVLRDYQDVRLVLHCFQSGSEILDAILDNPNWFLSFTGIITYPSRTEHIIAAAKKAPLEKIMIETDTPFLAPVPYRGQTNEPAYVVEIARKIAEIKNLPLEEIAIQTTQNAENFFKI